MPTPSQTVQIEYHRKFAFKVIIDGVDENAVKFQAITSPDSEFTVIEQPEGGSLTNQMDPGKRKFAPVTAKRGQTNNREIWDWHEAIGESVSNNGTLPIDKRTVSIVVLRVDGSEFGRWELYEAWPSKYVPGEFDAGNDNENAIEEVTFTYRYAKWVPAA